jgi:hypothetical protein
MHRLAVAISEDDPSSVPARLQARIVASARLIATETAASGDQRLDAVHDDTVRDAETLVAIAPRNRTYLHLLSVRVGTAALHYSAAGQFDRATELLRRTIPRLESMVEAEPDQLDTRYHLAESFANLAVLEVRKDRVEPARAAYRSGLAAAAPLLATQPRNPAFVGVVARLHQIEASIEATARRQRGDP